MGTNTCDINVGRLLEIRVAHGFKTVGDVARQYARLQEVFREVPETQQVVIAADWRRCPLMSPDAAVAMRKVLTDFNQRIERSAILGYEDSPMTVLQFFRVIREGAHPERKLFTSVSGMLGYLHERLTDFEMMRLRAFVNG